MEYRRKCNACGKIFCFTDEDLKNNTKNSAMAALNAIGQIGSVFGGTIFHTSYYNEQSNRFSDKVVDYYKCPYCNSSDIKIVGDDDLEEVNSDTNKLLQKDAGYFKLTEQALLMSEKYERVFMTTESIYTANSPVIFLSGALFKHIKTNEIIAQLKFQNISKKIIKAVKIEIVAIDSFEEQIDGISDFAYIDLNICAGRQWGENIAIRMPNASARKVDVNLKQIIFNDGSIWNNTETRKILLNNVVSLEEALKDRKLVEQFKMEYGKNARNLYLEEHDIWHCVCGTINLSCDEECCVCMAKKELLATYDLEKLKVKTNERLKKEQLKRKEAEEELQRKQQEQKKSNLRVLMSFVVALIVIIIGWFVCENVLAPKNLYEHAQNLYNEENYEEAKKEFLELGEYKNAKEWVDDCEFKINEKKYNQAIALYNEGKWVALDDSIDILRELGDYSDSAELLKKVELDYYILRFLDECAYGKDTEEYFVRVLNNGDFAFMNSKQIQEVITGTWDGYVYDTAYGRTDTFIFKEDGTINYSTKYDDMNYWQVKNDSLYWAFYKGQKMIHLKDNIYLTLEIHEAKGQKTLHLSHLFVKKP